MASPNCIELDKDKGTCDKRREGTKITHGHLEICCRVFSLSINIQPRLDSYGYRAKILIVLFFYQFPR